MKIGVFVGSFNPVHKGHIKIAKYLVNNNYVDKLLIIPSPNYWDKNNLIDIKDRINMLKYYETDKIIINETLNDLPYTYEVINELKKEYKTDELYLIIGADNIILFDKWKHYKELLKLNIIIYTRNDIDIKSHLERLNKKDKYIIIDKVKNIDISSTQVREKIKNHENLNKYLDDFVINYINKNKLYLE